LQKVRYIQYETVLSPDWTSQLLYYTKLLKKSEGTLSPTASVSVVQPMRCFTLVHPSPGFFLVTCGQC
jgi:hypothetical protein